jgi:hypothetical protein
MASTRVGGTFNALIIKEADMVSQVICCPNEGLTGARTSL